jgi:putative membrane protein
MKNRLVAPIVLGITAAGIAASAPAAGAFKAPPTVSGQDQTYLQSGLEGDAFEVKGGRLALRRSTDPAVRRAARAYAGDHKKSAAETKRLAKALGVQADFSPSPSQQWEIQMLANIDASVFDHWYSYLETLDHKQDLFEARQEVENGSNPSVVASARKEIPMLKRHLKLARAAQQANPLR